MVRRGKVSPGRGMWIVPIIRRRKGTRPPALTWKVRRRRAIQRGRVGPDTVRSLLSPWPFARPGPSVICVRSQGAPRGLITSMLPAAWLQRMPWGLLAAAGGLAALGCCGIARSEELADSSGQFLRQQFVWTLVALGAGWLATIPSYRVMARYSYAAFAVALVLLVAVYFFPTVHGTHRWLRVAGVGLQPSEFAKMAMVLALRGI